MYIGLYIQIFHLVQSKNETVLIDRDEDTFGTLTKNNAHTLKGILKEQIKDT